jgi:hypothetical protein
MGSADVRVDPDDDRLHVGWSSNDRCWWAVGREGSYGSAETQARAIDIACDASHGSSNGRRRIVVHGKDGHVVEDRSSGSRGCSPQFFQDEVE